jgi:FMN-dependent NADH-azoreductase
MTNLLVIQSATRGTGSHSRKLVEATVERLVSEGDVEVRVRDLVEEPVPHVHDEYVKAIRTPIAEHTDAHRETLGLSEKLIEELFWADLVIIGVPMYNFGIPSVLKAYLDQVVRSGRTFQSTPEGLKGLLTGRRAIVIGARGGVYEGAAAALDFQLPYLKRILGLIGMEVEAVSIDGTARGDDVWSKSTDGASEQLRTLIPPRQTA